MKRTRMVLYALHCVSVCLTDSQTYLTGEPISCLRARSITSKEEAIPHVWIFG
jgi:hypothetical protein